MSRQSLPAVVESAGGAVYRDLLGNGERGVTVANVYVRADGARLAALVAALADGRMSLHVGATFPLADAATALQGAVTGRADGATVLTLEGVSSDAVDHS